MIAKRLTNTNRRNGSVFCWGLTLILVTAGISQKTAFAAAGLNALGPENSQLARRVRTWDVVETVWATPGAAPSVTHAAAERRMIGAFLQETLRPAPGSADILRLDYLSFHRVEGCWKYVSMDMRAPVGIMSAESFGRGAGGQIDLRFQPIAIPAALEGASVTGQLLRMDERIVQQDLNHDRKDQYFIRRTAAASPGSGTAMFMSAEADPNRAAGGSRRSGAASALQSSGASCK